MKKMLKRLWNDESAQGATEYILLLVVIVGMVVIFKGRIKQMINTQMSNLDSQMSQFK